MRRRVLKVFAGKACLLYSVWERTHGGGVFRVGFTESLTQRVMSYAPLVVAHHILINTQPLPTYIM